MKIGVFKTLILLTVCLALAISAFGCTPTKENPSSSSSINENLSSDTSSNVEDDLDETSSEEIQSSEDNRDDTLDNITDEVPEGEEYQELTVLNSGAPITREFLGINGVHMMFEYVEDAAGGRYLTEEQIQTHADRIQDMGITIVRSLFSSSTAWNGKTQSFDFNSRNFKGFIKSCKLMQDRDIELAISPGVWSFSGIVLGNSTNSEVPNPSSLGGSGIGFKPIVNSEYEIDEQALKETMANYYKFMSDAVLQFEANGIHNIKYFVAFTETNNTIARSLAADERGPDISKIERSHYDVLEPIFGAAITTIDTALKDVGVRNKYKIVAPNDNWGGDFEIGDETAYSYLIRYTLEHLADKVDIIGTHRHYSMGNDYSDDIYYDYPFMALDSTHTVTAAAGKPMWLDEYGVGVNKSNTRPLEEQRTLTKNPVKGVAFGSMVNGVMNLGVENCIIWQIDNQQWPNNSTSVEFDNGMQVTNGYLPSPLESMTPFPAWYSFSMLSKYIGRGEVYECTVGYGVYMSCIKRTDGNWTIVATNHTVDDVPVKIMLEKSLGGKTFYRHRYTTQIVPTPSATMIGVDAVAENITTGFYDTLSGYSVSVYTTVKD